MKNKVLVALAGLILTLIMAGCETLSSYVNSNPIGFQTATRLAVGQYIVEGSTIEQEIKRAEAVQATANKAKLFLQGNPQATTDELLQVVDDSIDWDQLTYRDRLLVDSILQALKRELENRPLFDPSTSIVIEAMFDTILQAAQIYMRVPT